MIYEAKQQQDPRAQEVPEMLCPSKWVKEDTYNPKWDVDGDGCLHKNVLRPRVR
jgi:hypothetical protein